MLQHPTYTRDRLQRLADDMRRKIYAEKRPVDELLVAGPVDRIAPAEAAKLEYRPAQLGDQLGPLWATFWYKAKATVPAEWAGRRVDLLWISHSEATLWVGGRSMQGLTWTQGDRPDAILAPKASSGQKLEFAIEMACNKLFGAGKSHNIEHVSPWVLDQCDIALFDEQAWELFYDFDVLRELEADGAKNNDLEGSWAGELLSELNRFANAYDANNRATWAEAHAILKNLYTRHNAARVHEQSAIGHAHIDTAWLWPLEETYRKCVRTFSSAVAYMDEYPDYKFGASQACQYDWIKGRNPELYERLAAKVKAGQFIPQGGTWVEPDCNVPSGEALCRQFLFGQRFFQREFGVTCSEFWNPDVFGYNGQLPQIMRQAGITRFLTQKLSWNAFNKPQHHTFTWQGIDGSEVLAHFPPTDTYNGNCHIDELRRGVRNYKDNDRSRHSMLLFGHGDGGGGPTKEMIERLQRARDLQGLPRTTMRSGEVFFKLLEKDCTDRPLVVGELYFEYHRGTYTTQANTKKNNRKCEFLLHDVEFLTAMNLRLSGTTYPSAELDRLWKIVLTNQFHDILPGSSIGLVYQDADRDYADVRTSGEKLRAAAVAAMGVEKGNWAPLNTTSFQRYEVATAPDGKLVFVAAPSYGIGQIIDAPDSVRLTQPSDERFVLENSVLRAELSSDGRLLSLMDKLCEREALAGPANIFRLYTDNPVNFDAWDIDPWALETGKDCPPAHSASIGQQSPLRAEVTFEHKLTDKSTLKQTVRLDAGSRRLEFHTEVDWHEDHKLLKVVFPVNVRAMNATYEMQFGSVERPTHYSNNFDLAKYEVPGHKWADLSEHGFGVSLLTESKYGFSTYGNEMTISLLRSPTSPDEKADRGQHTFAYAIMPHKDGWRDASVVAEGFRFNVPLSWTKAAGPRSFAATTDGNLVIDTIKKAEDSEALIVRLYECHGGRGKAYLHLDVPLKSASFCNVLEEQDRPANLVEGAVEIEYGPYQIVTVKIK